MSRSIDRSPNRTIPPLSPAEKAAGARGGTPPWLGRSIHGKPQPPIGRRQTRGDPPGGKSLGAAGNISPQPQGTSPPEAIHFHAQDKSPPGFLPDGVAFPWNARGSPPGFPGNWNPGLGHGPPGKRFFVSPEVRLSSHGPPRQAPPTYGHSSGPNLFARTSNHEDPPPLGTTTGPPGRKTENPVNHWPPSSHHSIGGAPPGRRQARGDPPGATGSRRGCDPPRSRAGPSPPRPFKFNRRGPPGPPTTHSSLSAGRWRERIPYTRPETARQDAARKPKPKSRKIKPWL